jgi:hypothetical protein
MPDQEVKDQDIKLLDDSIDRLMEHFDTVHIFVTRQESANQRTVRVDLGKGNWYAKYGQIDLWLKCQIQDELHIDMNSKIKDD